MYFVAPFIFGALLAIVLLFSSFLLKIFVKIESFAGFCAGVCCSVIVSILITIYLGVVLYLFVSNAKSIEDSARQQKTVSGLENFTRGALLLLWLFIAVLLVIVYVIIFLFTKRISKPESEYNSVLMFASGFAFLPTLFFYLSLFVFVNGINKIIEERITPNMTKEQEEQVVLNAIGFTSGVILTFAAIGFFLFMLSIAGTIIMCMIHHRKLNSFVIWIGLACFFGPMILFLLCFLTYKIFFIEYPLGLPTLASFGFGIFFYLKYSDESNRGEALNQQNYELTN